MINLILFLGFIAAIYIIIRSFKTWWGWQHPKNTRSHNELFHCACGCHRIFRGTAGWDGYHGPDWQRPVTIDHWPEKHPRAIDKPDDYVLGWEDIEWTVEKRLKEG